VEEFHVITWEAKKEQIFEMPTGGAAIMRQGPNLLKLARKEQCLALLTQLRTKFKTDGFIYRVFPNGEVQYLHPKVGGRVGVHAAAWGGIAASVRQLRVTAPAWAGRGCLRQRPASQPAVKTLESRLGGWRRMCRSGCQPKVLGRTRRAASCFQLPGLIRLWQERSGASQMQRSPAACFN
jgi:hypothetical protein